ncbi:biopolymer transporter ExbD [Lentimicrobium sp.]|jgi:biopolymer transport protein ExbD|uniref:ExbD/TolR family protein n=1 Tax=Lentimicrobium sp. TaxID=2034841 RepID=UPI0025DC5983|nr:biopolymer transporter ExbD [Lentimicrobium sp.]MCO5257281.1 biopolymer transporter ExbD [Lentimicrobium sp.]MCO5263013.1 biopolymer transporter ExbD [Lentimicrobium sp.]HOP13074.1 biopolymer transporter ExbD [Lentimicrobium sp.]HPF65273.1 biopolymer transporter ExbD [Lentimicrobium sp.]HPJ62831.1 biopolymer transporter ExbD [Lentimicrobium sp.]
MARFKKEKSGELPAISTASMPDIIFMLLFFFMVTTTMREVTLKVRNKMPEATEVQKLEKKALVSFIYIGPPIQSKLYGTESRIQLNDSFRTVADIAEFIYTEREARVEADRPLLTTSLKVDQEVKMGVVTDVKQELRKVGAFKINYSTRKKAAKTLE